MHMKKTVKWRKPGDLCRREMLDVGSNIQQVQNKGVSRATVQDLDLVRNQDRPALLGHLTSPVTTSGAHRCHREEA